MGGPISPGLISLYAHRDDLCAQSSSSSGPRCVEMHSEARVYVELGLAQFMRNHCEAKVVRVTRELNVRFLINHVLLEVITRPEKEEEEEVEVRTCCLTEM